MVKNAIEVYQALANAKEKNHYFRACAALMDPNIFSCRSDSDGIESDSEGIEKITKTEEKYLAAYCEAYLKKHGKEFLLFEKSLACFREFANRIRYPVPDAIRHATMAKLRNKWK